MTWQGPTDLSKLVIHELCVLGDGLLRDRMNDAIADLFDIDVVLESVRGNDKVFGDRVTGGIVERQVDYMVENMHGNAGGVPG